MNEENRERWRHLCELAAVEQDHNRLMELISEINRLLQEKEGGRFEERGTSLDRSA
jgi:hypothetical protein